MSLRRFGATVPLALLVAVLAHGVGFGTDHAPGAEHAAALLGCLGAAMGLLGFATLLEAALGLDHRDDRAAQQDRWLPLLLAAGGACAYGAIELVEGHASLGGSLRSLFAIVPAAALIGHVARLAGRTLRRSGRALAAFVAAPAYVAAKIVRLAVERRVCASSAERRGLARGRAPPLLV